MAFPPCSLPDALHIPALFPLLLELPRVFPMLCLVSPLLHSVPCSQLTNQHKLSCRCMQPLLPFVLSLQCWLWAGLSSALWLGWMLALLDGTRLLRLGGEGAGGKQWVVRAERNGHGVEEGKAI